MNFHKLAVMTAVISLCTIVHIFGLERMAVVPFGAGDGVNPLVAAAIGETFSLELSKTGGFMVIAQNEIYQQLESHGIQNAVTINDDSAIQIGNDVKADVIYLGTVMTTDGGVTMSISVKCIDVLNGKYSFTKTVSAKNQPNILHTMTVILAQQIVSDKNNSKNSGDLSDKQIMHIERLTQKGADISNGDDMKYWFHYYLRMGIAGVVIDSVLTSLVAASMGAFAGVDAARGIPFFSVYVGVPITAALMTIDWIISPILCVIGFVRMGRTYSIYRKATGNKKFVNIRQVSFGGGYNWEEKEVSVAMAIKL